MAIGRRRARWRRAARRVVLRPGVVITGLFRSRVVIARAIRPGVVRYIAGTVVVLAVGAGTVVALRSHVGIRAVRLVGVAAFACRCMGAVLVAGGGVAVGEEAAGPLHHRGDP